MGTTEEYRKTVLENGFEVHTHKLLGVTKTYAEIRNKVGSDNEPNGKSGIAHYLEHMFGYGSKKYTEPDLIPFFKDQGGMFNFTTGRNRTFYWRYALLRKIPDFLERVSDVLLHPAFTPDHVDLERTPILDEQANDFADIDTKMFLQVGKAIFPNHKISVPLIGHRSDIDSMSFETLREFYDDTYRASNMFLVAAGDVDHDYLVALAEEKFGGMPKRPPIDPVRRANFIPGTHICGGDFEKTQMYLGFAPMEPTVNEQLIERHAVSILTRKIDDELRLNNKLLYTPNSGLDNLGYMDLFYVNSSLNPRLITKAVNGVFDVMKECASEITESDIEVVVNHAEEDLADQANHPYFVGQRMAETLQIRGKYISFEQEADVLKTITTDDIQLTVRKMLSHDPYLATVGPTEDVPNVLEIAQRTREALGIEKLEHGAGLRRSFDVT